jgi:hypothetical protein
MYEYKVNVNYHVVSRPKFNSLSNGALRIPQVESYRLKIDVECTHRCIF